MMRIRQRLTRSLIAALLPLAASVSAAATNDADLGSSQLAPIVIGTPTDVIVFPESIVLESPRQVAHVVVTGTYDSVSSDSAPEGSSPDNIAKVQDLTRAAQISIADESIARVAAGRIEPVADGETVARVEVAGLLREIPVVVRDYAVSDPISFGLETLAALSKHGCNSGACHGSPSGKGGFRLSLRAYDAALDERTLVREAWGRRTNVFAPEKSLLLRKPLMEVAHGGGKRLSTAGHSYQVLRDWIAEGCQLHSDAEPHCDAIEVYPRGRVLHRLAHTQQLVVLAHLSDGTVHDITRLAVFSSSDELVATVDEDGLVTGQDRGESAILVRYLEHIETSQLMFLKDIEGFAWQDTEEANYVDTHVFAKLQKLKILPSDICTDEEFVRRVCLDVTGLLPTAAEAEAFLADTAVGKRSALVDRLLGTQEYAEFWALKWGDLFRVNEAKIGTAGVHKFHRWLVASVRDNRPYDEFVHDLITASGSTHDNPAANYYRAATDMNDCVETTSQLFLGVRIQCAKCHNHPFERWTQDNYYGIGAFFNRVARKEGDDPDETIVLVSRQGEVTQPRTQQRAAPWLPLSGETEIPEGEDRRDRFAGWLISPDNPFFAKAEVNRIWGHLFGRGIVDPVDDFRASNPPANAALLDALAADFVEHGFDRKHIIRTILSSRTYQLSARKHEFNMSDDKYFSHAEPRPLTAEQLLDGVCQVTGVEEKFAGLPAGTRAISLPSPNVDNAFLKVFGQPEREIACACERSTESNLSQALQMINGPLIHEKLQHPRNRFRRLVAHGASDEEIIGELYLAALCRPPSDEELAAAVAHIAAQDERLLGLEDVCWAVLNAKEFLFQH